MPASSDKSNSTYSNSTEVLLNEKGMKQEANDQVILATEAESIADGSGKDNADQNAPLVSPSKGEDLEGDDDVDTELEKEHAGESKRKGRIDDHFGIKNFNPLGFLFWGQTTCDVSEIEKEA